MRLMRMAKLFGIMVLLSGCTSNEEVKMSASEKKIYSFCQQLSLKGHLEEGIKIAPVEHQDYFGCAYLHSNFSLNFRLYSSSDTSQKQQEKYEELVEIHSHMVSDPSEETGWGKKSILFKQGPIQNLIALENDFLLEATLISSGLSKTEKKEILQRVYQVQKEKDTI